MYKCGPIRSHKWNFNPAAVRDVYCTCTQGDQHLRSVPLDNDGDAYDRLHNMQEEEVIADSEDESSLLESVATALKDASTIVDDTFHRGEFGTGAWWMFWQLRIEC